MSGIRRVLRGGASAADREIKQEHQPITSSPLTRGALPRLGLAFAISAVLWTGVLWALQ